MRILQINNCHHIRGGADAVYFNTAELLQKNGQEVFYFSMKDEKMLSYEYADHFPKAINYRDISLISKIKSSKTFFYNKEAYHKLNAYIKFIKPDIAHIHLFMGGLSVSILDALKVNNIPIVHTIHDYRLICPAYTFLDKNNHICEQCIDKFYLRCAYKRCSLENNSVHSAMLSIDSYYRTYMKNPTNYIDKYIFVSDFSKNIHIKFDPKFEIKAHRIYNFHSNIKDSFNSVKGDYLFYYGRLSREKGINLLVEVAKELKIKLKIAGTGTLFDELNNNTDENIELLGFKTGNELWSLIQNSLFVVVPSEWYENNPLTIVESFSYGKPVIGSQIGGITELLQDGRGVLFEPKNKVSLTTAILRAFSISDDEYDSYSERVLDFAVNEFSEKNHYDALINTYNSLLCKYN
jgi:glycosyltransferase involved in cell wall biosynthesis